MQEWIYGRNPVFETLRAARRIFFRLHIAQGLKEKGAIRDILMLCSKKKIPIQEVRKEWFEDLGTRDHQSVALQVSAYPYGGLNEILSLSKQRGETPFILILDTLQDPQNLGGLLRTAEAVGVHGVCLPFRRTATVTPAVVNRSSGASEHLLIVQANLAQIIAQLKKEGLWILGLERSSDAIFLQQAGLDGPIAIVVGSEGGGMRRLIRNSCDVLLQLPMRGKISSLNASIAGSVVLYKVWEGRGYLKSKTIDAQL
jgi:23S rRNA (guanosine2251-2'-O)-methyltransferase